MKERRVYRLASRAGIAFAAMGLLTTLCVAVFPSSASAIDGTFIPVVQPASCTLAAGFTASGSNCQPGIGTNFYVFLPTNGANLTYSFTVPSNTNATLTYGLPAGAFVNDVAGTVSLDGGAAVTVNSDLGAFNQKTPTDLTLYTSPVLGPGPHTWTMTSTGDAVNIYGLWLADVGVTVPCGTGTTTCAAALSVPSQTVKIAGAKTTSTSASINVQVATATLSCTNFSYAAPVLSLTDSGLKTGTSVSITDEVAGLPSKKGVLVCYQPIGNGAPPPVLLRKCHGKKFTVACVKSLTEVGGSILANLLVPAGDPRAHIGGAVPVVTGVSTTAPKPGTILTIKGLNLSQVTRVTIGGVVARISKTALAAVKVITPAKAHGVVAVTSLARTVTSRVVVTVA